MLVALVAVDRVSPWIAMVIVGRELVLLGLRAAVASEGRHLEASLLGKWKATVQFVAIALAIVRPDVIVAGEYLDEWAMLVAAVVTAWSGIDYLLRFVSSPALRPVSRVFVTGGSGVVGGALVDSLRGRDDDVVALARSEASGPRSSAAGRAWSAATSSTPRCSPGAWRAATPSTTWPGSTRSASRIRRRCCARTSRVPPWRSARPRRPGWRGSCTPPRRPPSASPRVRIGNEDTPHRGWFLSTYERSKTEGEKVAFETGRQEGVEVVSVNPCRRFRALAGPAARPASSSPFSTAA